MEEQYTISIFTEDHIGLINRITIIFTRRHINILSLTTSETEAHGIYRFTLVVNTTREQVKKVCDQIERQIDVFAAYFHRSDEVVYQEIALYKMPVKQITGGSALEQIIRKHNARILTVEEAFIIIEKTGQKEETQALLEELEPFGVMEFVRSGRVAIIKKMWQFNESLHAMEMRREEVLEA